MEYSFTTTNLLLLLLLVSSSFSSLAIAITFRVDRSTCSSVLVSLSPCSSELASHGSSGSSSSSNTSPSSSCCDPLEIVLSNATQFNCLCSLLGNPQYQSMLQSALRLPQLCHLSIVTSEANCTTFTSSSNNGSSPSYVPATLSSAASNSISVAIIALSFWICVSGLLPMFPLMP